MKRMLFVTDVNPYPPDAGNKHRIISLLEFFKTHDGVEIDVLFLCRAWNTAQSFVENWSENVYIVHEKKNYLKRCYIKSREILYNFFGTLINFNIDDWYDSQMSDVAHRLNLQNKYDVVWVEYVYLSKVLKVFDKSIIKIIDTHDSFSNRGEIFKKNNLPLEFFFCSERSEKKGLKRANYIVSVSKEESHFFSKLLGKNLTKYKVITIGNFMKASSPVLCKDKTILFVGSCNTMNLASIKNFIEYIFPSIKKEVPESKLLICGKVCNKLEDSGEYELLGFVKDIDSVYEKARVVICPTIGGTGQHLKCIEAIHKSKPVVTTKESERGIPYKEIRPFEVADLNEAFAEKVIRCLKDDSYATKLSKRAYCFSTNQNDKKNLKDFLNSIL